MPTLHAAFLAGGIGDQLMHFSQMQAFTKLHGGKFDIFCQHVGVMRKIGQECHWLNEVYDIGQFKKLGRMRQFMAGTKSLSKSNYQHSIVFHPSSSFKAAAFLAGIPIRIGLHNQFLDRFALTETAQDNTETASHHGWGHRPFGAAFDKYLADRNIDPIGSAPIASPAKKSAEFESLITQFPKPYFVVNLYSADPARRWPTEHAASCLARLVAEHKGTLFLSSGNDAREWNDQFLEAWPVGTRPPIDLLREGKDLRFELELYHQADCYIGVNSFTANLAMNCDLPSVVLYNKEVDFLNYRGNSVGLFPKTGAEIASIGATDISDAVTRILS